MRVSFLFYHVSLGTQTWVVRHLGGLILWFFKSRCRSEWSICFLILASGKQVFLVPTHPIYLSYCQSYHHRINVYRSLSIGQTHGLVAQEPWLLIWSRPPWSWWCEGGSQMVPLPQKMGEPLWKFNPDLLCLCFGVTSIMITVCFCFLSAWVHGGRKREFDLFCSEVIFTFHVRSPILTHLCMGKVGRVSIKMN